jgi:hypothetical protein
MAKERGLKTFLSLEPIIFMDDALEIIRLTHNVVDVWKVGKLNYHPMAKQINWKDVAAAVIGQLEDFNCSYYIKKDLAQYVGKPEGIIKRISKFTI